MVSCSLMTFLGEGDKSKHTALFSISFRMGQGALNWGLG